MRRREETLHDLKKTKIVIGNGFDLFCGLKSTYKDFFSFYHDKYDCLCKWTEEAASILHQNPRLNEDPWGLVNQAKKLDLINCWDVFFAMIFDRMRGYLWCDVESEMLDSLSKRDSVVDDDYKPHWDDVWEFIRKENVGSHKPGSVILGQFLVKNAGGVPKTRDEFYEFLLGQLREFENYFGRFITRQHLSWNQFQLEFNNSYIRNARSLLEQLCDPNEIASIDCFNYGFTPEPEFYERCKFVNGDCLNPIFGIDSVFGPSDPRYVFTKTNRRIEWAMNKSVSADGGTFQNVIVFGHSLSQHDYNYFFPVLDELEMTSFSAKGKLVVAYSVYDESKSAEIKKGIRNAVYSLFSAYAEYCGRLEPTRLLDSLTTQGRVLTLEVSKTSTQGRDFLQNIDYWPEETSEECISGRWQKYLEYGRSMSK